MKAGGGSKRGSKWRETRDLDEVKTGCGRENRKSWKDRRL